MRFFFVLLPCVLLVGVSALQAQSGFVPTRAGLPSVLVRGKLRFYYTTQGEHAVAAGDANANGVPDAVEDAAAQTEAAFRLLVEGLGFPDPFKSPRFAGKVAFLDVHFLSRDLLKSNGLTYDEIQRFRRPGDAPDTGSLCFDLATSVQASANLTPAHEMFHIIQNGATFFKNRWYTEGTARWSEAALGLGGAGSARTTLRGSWPPAEDRWKALFEMTYDASPQFWEPMALALDPGGELTPALIPAEVRQMRYVNGEPVLKDLKLNGWKVIRQVLLELDREDDTAFQELKLARWSEDAQKSPANLPHIQRAILRAVEAAR